MKQKTICMFTYRGEEDIVLLSVELLRHTAPLASVFIFDDASDPLPQSAVDILSKMAGVYYRVSEFARNKNLNGKEAVVGVLSCLQQACKEDENDDGYVIKTDPDTLFLRPQQTFAELDKGVAWLTHPTQRKFFSGMFYALSVDHLSNVIKNAMNMIMPDNAEEDLVVGSLCYIATHKDPRNIVWINSWSSENNHRFCAFQTDKWDDHNYISEVASKAHILTVGNPSDSISTKLYRSAIADQVIRVFNNPSSAISEANVKADNPSTLS